MEVGVQSISDFVQSTTAHGFSRVHSSHSLPIKCMWVLFLVGAMGGFGYHLAMLSINFASTPISANISPGSIQFHQPDITVCSVSPISYSNFYETYTRHPYTFLKLLLQAWTIMEVTAKKNLTTSPDILMQVSRDMFDPQLLLRYLGHRREYFIASCKFKGIPCTFEDFQSFWDSKYGNCFRFQPRQKLISQTTGINDFLLDLVLFTDTNPILVHPNSSQVFGMLNAAATFEGEYDVSKSGGAILFYGDSDTYPRDFINLSPGLHSYVDFQMVEHRYVSRRSKRCLNDGGSVFYEDSKGDRIEFKKNRIDCQYRKLMDAILNDCGCFSTRIAPPYANKSETINMTRCQILELSTSTDVFIRRRNCEKLYLQQRSSKFNEMTGCLPNCMERIYTPVISMTSWPLNPLALLCMNEILSQSITNIRAFNATPPQSFDYFMQNLTTVADVQRDFSTNFAQVSLAAYNPFGELIEEVESYQFFDLFSDIGGILGLYLGVSLLTMCELFELFFVLISELRTAKNAYMGRKLRKQGMLKHRITSGSGRTSSGNDFMTSSSSGSVSTIVSEDMYTKPVQTFPSVSRLRLMPKAAVEPAPQKDEKVNNGDAQDSAKNLPRPRQPRVAKIPPELPGAAVQKY